MRNSLFSDYYLAELFPHDDEVVRLRSELGTYRQRLRDLVDDVAGTASALAEAGLEDRLIRPALRVLGFEYLVQTPLREQGVRTPDYLLYGTATVRRQAETIPSSAARYAIGLAEAKRWEHPLDRRTGTGFDNANPSFQIDGYLRLADQEWGILTNGRHWRLYNRGTSFQLDSFLEIDLLGALEDDQELLTFLALFRAAAFARGATPALLARAYGQSIEHGARLGKELEGNVYEALRLLAGRPARLFSAG